jgi:hypothetical protein
MHSSDLSARVQKAFEKSLHILRSSFDVREVLDFSSCFVIYYVGEKNEIV